MLEELRYSLERFIKDQIGRRKMRFGTVVSFEDETIVTVKEEETGYTDSVLLGDNVLEKPKVGSNVWYGAPDESEGVLKMLSGDDLDLWQIIIAGLGIKVSADGVVINGGSNGGVVIVTKLVERLNRLEQQLLTHQHICTAPGTPSALDPSTNPPIVATTVLDLANPKLTH